MTRDEILAQYQVRGETIVSAGPFEGEPIYAPHYWDKVVNGLADAEIEGTCLLRVLPDERAQFPELGTIKLIMMWENTCNQVFCRDAEKMR